MTTPQLLCSSKAVGHLGDGSFSRLSNTFDSNDDGALGLLITLHKNVNDSKGGSICEISLCPDAQYPDIHPNAYAPAALTDMRKLGGGGSGVAVFEGQHPTLGDVVMKHGGDKDMKELFALATIAEELHKRGKANPKAAAYLQERIPEFRMIYISPQHLGEKRRELWHKLSHLYKYSSRNLLVLPEDDEEEEEKGTDHNEFKPETKAEDELMHSHSGDQISPLQRRKQGALRHKHNPFQKKNNGLKITESGTVSGHRSISVYSNIAKGSGKSCGVELLGDTLIVSVPSPGQDETMDGVERPIPLPGDGYQILKDLVDDLIQLQKEHKWKFTLGQKRIGGDNPKTGNIWLYESALHGPLLDNLINQKIQLVRDLATLTTDDEKDPKFLKEIQLEMVKFEEEEDVTPADISVLTDSFVGNAIKKNFQMDIGRFAMLTHLGRQFRDFSSNHPDLRPMSSMSSSENLSQGMTSPSLRKDATDLVLLPEEEIAAHHLGCLTRNGALMGDTFENVPYEPSVLEMTPLYWRNLLRAAIQPRRQSMMSRTSKMALTRIWTCGLTDAGVHNLFLTDDAMWLFDLGQPQLYSAPGFLTKFLFSFFHTLGMEETSDGDGWVRRFEHNPDTKKLRLTKDTEILLDKAYSAFETTLDRMINDLFDGDDSLRWLLIQYVTLQLMSDASFCLQRWTIKGGGRTRDANHQKGIEKWLWRALWDLFVAFDINTSETWTKLYVEHPSHRDSVFFSDMKDLVGEGFLSTLQGIDETESSIEHVRRAEDLAA